MWNSNLSRCLLGEVQWLFQNSYPFNAQENMGVPFDRNFNSISRRDHQIISYERRDYESVDEKSLFYAMSRKRRKKI